MQSIWNSAWHIKYYLLNLYYELGIRNTMERNGSYEGENVLLSFTLQLQLSPLLASKCTGDKVSSIHTTNSLTPAVCPATRFSSDTIYLELVSESSS